VVTPNMNLRVFHIGGYWRGANDMVRQMMLGLRSTGAVVYEYNTDEHPEALDCEGRVYDRGTTGPVWLRWEILRDEIEAFSPNMIVCNAGGLSFRPETASRLREKLPLVGIALSDPEVFAPATSQIACNFDLFLTNEPSCLPDYTELGARAVLLPIATNEEFFRPMPPHHKHKCDVAIFGRAHPDRIEPVQAVSREFDLHLYGEGWEEPGLSSRGLLYGDDLLSALNSANITIVFFRTVSGHAQIKVGIFDFLAAGALVATNHFEELKQYLTFDKEVIGFNSTLELLEKIAYYLGHSTEAQEVRAAGRARVLREHTWKQVWPRIVEQVAAVR